MKILSVVLSYQLLFNGKPVFLSLALGGPPLCNFSSPVTKCPQNRSAEPRQTWSASDKKEFLLY